MSDTGKGEWLTQWEYAHRGLHSPGVPENSLAGAKAAVMAGFGIECDIQLSADDCAMVFHDWELDRLTNRKGPTYSLRAQDLGQCELLGSGEKPASLEAWLEEIDGAVPLLIEIKSRPGFDVERACGPVAEALSGYAGDHCVMSFDPCAPKWFAKHSPETLRGLVCTDTLDLGFRRAWREPGAIEAAEPDFLAMDIRDLPNSIMSRWRETGRPLLSWTIRSADLRARALSHVDALISEGEGLP